MRSRQLVIVLVLGLLNSACGSAGLDNKFSCPVTPKLELTPVIALAAGAHPVSLVDGSNGRWPGPETPAKTVWIVARNTPGDLEVTARRLDGDGRVLFYVRGALAVEKLSIPHADDPQMLPGGADQATLNRFSFRGSAIYYSNPGCWEFNITYHGEISRVVVSMM